MTKTLKLKRSSVSGKVPDSLEYGELAINYYAGNELISLQNSDDEIVSFPVEIGTTLASHILNTDNPHSVTASQVGLGNVDNTADADKPVSDPQQEALDLKLNIADYDGTDSDGNYVATDDSGIIDNLTTSSSVKALSARQGYILAQELSEASGGATDDLTELASRVTSLEEEVADLVTYVTTNLDTTINAMYANGSSSTDNLTLDSTDL